MRALLAIASGPGETARAAPIGDAPAFGERWRREPDQAPEGRSDAALPASLPASVGAAPRRRLRISR